MAFEIIGIATVVEDKDKIGFQADKQSGDKVVQHSRRGKEHLSKLKRQESIEDKIDVLSDALDEMFDGLVQTRLQIGNLVGISVASVLISERSTKELTKILNKRR